MDEDTLQRLYGPWRPWTPATAAEVLADWNRPWWIAGGWSIDAFTGTARHHADIDIGVLRDDVVDLRAHLGQRWHCWAAGDGALRPLTDGEPELPPWAEQMWVREHALAPWVVDILACPARDGDWVFRRDPSIVLPVAEIGWRDAAGILQQRPEITLAFKAKHLRAKDEDDLQRTWPLLDPTARRWLLDTVARLHPGHPWLARLPWSPRSGSRRGTPAG